jgi:hypothetical protein
MNAIPDVGDVAEKKVCRASTPPAEAPIPTTGKGNIALAARSTGAAASSGEPEGVAAASSRWSFVDDVTVAVPYQFDAAMPQKAHNLPAPAIRQQFLEV